MVGRGRRVSGRVMEQPKPHSTLTPGGQEGQGREGPNPGRRGQGSRKRAPRGAGGQEVGKMVGDGGWGVGPRAGHGREDRRGGQVWGKGWEAPQLRASAPGGPWPLLRPGLGVALGIPWSPQPKQAPQRGMRAPRTCGRAPRVLHPGPAAAPSQGGARSAVTPRAVARAAAAGAMLAHLPMQPLWAVALLPLRSLCQRKGATLGGFEGRFSVIFSSAVGQGVSSRW